jgi:hypothetical protein
VGLLRRCWGKCVWSVTLLAAIAACLVCLESPVLAQASGQAPAQLAPRPKHRIVYSSLLAARLNPLGLENRLWIGYRRRLFNSGKLLLREANIGIAFSPTITPSMARVGGTLEVRPLTVLSLSAAYYFVGFFNTFGFLQSYQSPRDDHSDTQIRAGQDAGRSYTTTGSELQLRAQLLGKVGPIVLRNTTVFYRSQMKLSQGDRLFYNPRIDALVPDGGWAMVNDTDLVWLTPFRLIAGVRFSVVHAFYRDGDYRAGESRDNINTPLMRVGPLLAYVFYDKPERRFNKPTLLMIINWHLKHRFRTGADVSRAIPYFVLGFRVSGELWKR